MARHHLDDPDLDDPGLDSQGRLKGQNRIDVNIDVNA